MGLENTSAPASAEDKKSFVNDLTQADKDRVKDALIAHIDDALAKPEHSVNDLVHLSFVAHGSIKGRAKATNSSRQILIGILDKTRATTTRTVNAQSIKSFLSSVSPEEKEKLLQELLAAQ